MSEIGKKYSLLEVIEDKFKYKNQTHVKCKCECGNIKICKLSKIKRGEIKSCGCFNSRKDKSDFSTIKKQSTIRSKLYGVWVQIHERCYNSDNISFKWYGAKGITVCPEWFILDNFINWALSNGYEQKLSIDRIKSEKGYCPENCRWVDRNVQSANRKIDNSNGYCGIDITKNPKKFRARIMYKGVTITLGSFYTIKEAVQFRNKYIIDNKLPHKIQDIV